MKKIFAALLFSFCLPVLSHGQDDQQRSNAQQQADQAYERFQRQGVKEELARLKTRFGVPDQVAFAITESLEQAIVEAAAARLKRSKEGDFVDVKELDKGLRRQLWDQVERLHERRVALNDYILGVEGLDEHLDSLGQRGLVLFLDNFLSLDRPQQKQLEELLAENWNSAWNSQLGLMMLSTRYQFGKPIIDSLDAEKIEEILTLNQFALFNELDELTAIFQTQQIMASELPDEYLEETFKPACNRLMQLKVEELGRSFSLKEAEMKMLRVASKAAVSKVVENWSELVDKANPKKRDMVAMRGLQSLQAHPIVYQCCSQEQWVGTMEKILPTPAFRRYQAILEDRQKQYKQQLLNQITRSVVGGASRIGFTYSEHVAFVEVFSNNIEYEYADHARGAMMLFDVSDEEFEKVLSDSQWDKFEPILTRNRQMNQRRQAVIDQMRQAQEGDK